jgi:predicted transcriptional regulator
MKKLLIERLSMKRSKLEIEVDILRVLARLGPLKLTHIMYKANVNCSVLREYLDLLTKQGLVDERIIGKDRTVFSVTQRGIKVLKYFRELKEILPLVEESKKRASIPY